MVRSSAFRVAVIVLLAAQGIASAQTPPAKPQPPANPKPPVVTAAGEIIPPDGPPPRPPVGQLLNIRLDLTITDQRTNNSPATKTVTLLLSDRNSGRIRTSGDVKVGNTFRRINLNVDAMPEVLRDGRIRVGCTVEYVAQLGQGNQDENQPSTVFETFNVILPDGRQTIVTQSADPASDRKVQVELKATVVK